MKISEYLRNRAFKLLDGVHKSPLKAYVQELEKFEAAGKPYQVIEEKLHVFLKAINDSSEWYKSKEGLFNLEDYPVVKKKNVQENLGQLLSLKYDKNKLVPVTTSGSYGTPTTFYLTPQKKRRQQAEAIHFSAKAGYQVGDCHGYFRTNLPKQGLKLWLQNQLFISSKVLDQHFLENTRSLLQQKKVRILIGFPSAMALLAMHCIEQGDQPEDFGIKGILTFAENLTAMQRNWMIKAFGCAVYSRYGTEELGILGIQKDNESGFDLNNLNYIFEVLALGEDVSVKPGEIGRVVVTDLHSDALPLIRYETGDLAELGEVYEENKGWAKSLRNLSGRQIQLLYSTTGEKLYPLFLDVFMEKSELFVQYQMIQESEKKFTLKLVPKQNFKIEDFSENELKMQLQDWLGEDAEIATYLVADIEALPSGKRPFIINRLANV